MRHTQADRLIVLHENLRMINQSSFILKTGCFSTEWTFCIIKKFKFFFEPRTDAEFFLPIFVFVIRTYKNWGNNIKSTIQSSYFLFCFILVSTMNLDKIYWSSTFHYRSGWDIRIWCICVHCWSPYFSFWRKEKINTAKINNFNLK